MSDQTRGHEAEHELLNRQASALYASENHLSAFEYALIAHLFQEPACTPNVHTEALVNFACAYSQGVFDGVQLAKPDIEAKASRLLDTAESVLTHNLVPSNSLSTNYVRYTLGKQLIDKASSAEAQLTSKLREVKHVDTLANRELRRAERAMLAELVNRIINTTTHESIDDAMATFLQLDALSTTIVIRHEMRDTIWLLGLARLKKVPVESDERLLAIDRALAVADFAGPTNSPFTCIEAAHALEDVVAAKTELERIRSRLLTDEHARPVGERSSPDPFAIFRNEISQLFWPTQRFLDEVTVKIPLDGRSGATALQIGYFNKLINDLGRLYETLRTEVQAKRWIEPSTLGHGAIILAQLEYGQRRFPEIFHEKQVVFAPRIVHNALDDERVATAAPTAGTGIRRRLSQRLGRTRPSTQREQDSCQLMNLGSSADHRHRLARLGLHAHDL